MDRLAPVGSSQEHCSQVVPASRMTLKATAGLRKAIAHCGSWESGYAQPETIRAAVACSDFPASCRIAGFGAVYHGLAPGIFLFSHYMSDRVGLGGRQRETIDDLMYTEWFSRSIRMGRARHLSPVRHLVPAESILLRGYESLLMVLDTNSRS